MTVTPDEVLAYAKNRLLNAARMSALVERLGVKNQGVTFRIVHHLYVAHREGIPINRASIASFVAPAYVSFATAYRILDAIKGAGWIADDGDLISVTDSFVRDYEAMAGDVIPKLVPLQSSGGGVYKGSAFHPDIELWRTIGVPHYVMWRGIEHLGYTDAGFAGSTVQDVTHRDYNLAASDDPSKTRRKDLIFELLTSNPSHSIDFVWALRHATGRPVFAHVKMRASLHGSTSGTLSLLRIISRDEYANRAEHRVMTIDSHFDNQNEKLLA